MSEGQQDIEVPKESGKAEEYLAEAEATKQKRKEAKKTPEAKIQPKKEEAFSTFKLFIREAPKLYSLTVLVPHLSPQLPTFARPNLLPVKKTLGTQLIPRISLLTIKREESCRVQILEPLPIRVPPLLPPKLTLERPIDISVRPLIYSQPIKSLNIIQPKLKPLRPHIPTLTPLLTPPVKPTSLCTPRLPAISSSSQREEKVSSTVERKEGEKQETVVEAKLTAEQKTEGAIGVGEEGAEELLDELFPPIRGEGICRWDHRRPICFVVTGESFDSREMLEDIVSTKYTFHGEYAFSKNLPWQVKSKEVEVALKRAEEVIKERESIREKLTIYEKITSKDLIVSEKVTEKDKEGIVKGLRDIANRGPKCVILYTDNLEPFQHLDKEVGPSIEVRFVRLPSYSDKTLHLIGELIGVEPKASSPSIKVAWADSIRHCEKVMKALNDKLKYKSSEVVYDPESETELHYLMKKVVYHILKQKHKNMEIEVEKEVCVTDESSQTLQIRPDIRVGEEFWEIETGYPTNEEKASLAEPDKPHARLINKLKKFRETLGKVKVNVVVQSIYAALFKDELKKVKDYEEIELNFYTLHWSEAEPTLKQPFKSSASTITPPPVTKLPPTNSSGKLSWRDFLKKMGFTEQEYYALDRLTREALKQAYEAQSE